jgi:hypothetical protein
MPYLLAEDPRSITYFTELLLEGFGICFAGTAQGGAEKANALPGGRTAPRPFAPSRAGRLRSLADVTEEFPYTFLS